MTTSSMGGGVGKEKERDKGSPSMALEALRDWGATPSEISVSSRAAPRHRAT